MTSILLIDDDDALRRTATRMLTTAGYEVVQAENGEAGLAKFDAVKPDLVITDVFMPEKDGIETAKQLRAQFPGVKILAITGGGREGRFYFLVRALGADSVLQKPFTKQALLDAVRQLLPQAV